MDIKKAWEKFWFIVWKDDSPKGWIISVIFLFVMIKFVFFPILSLVTGTSLPLAIVESCSMYHQGNLISNYNNWWLDHENKYLNVNINETQFSDFIFKKGFNKGDILFVLGAKPDKLKIGDVIIFNAGTNNPVIHRIIKISNTADGRMFSTMGDNNNGQLPSEETIAEEQIMGKAVFKLGPYLGWVKLIFYEPFRPESQRGFCREN